MDHSGTNSAMQKHELCARPSSHKMRERPHGSWVLSPNGAASHAPTRARNPKFWCTKVVVNVEPEAPVNHDITRNSARLARQSGRMHDRRQRMDSQTYCLTFSEHFE